MTRIRHGGTRPPDGFLPAVLKTRAKAAIHPQWVRAGFLTLALVSTFVGAGCRSEPQPGPRGVANAPRKPYVPLAGHEEFFDGQILAEIHVGTEGMPEVRPGDGPRGDREVGPGRGGRRGGGGGRMNVAGGPGGFGGNIGGSMPFGEGGGRPREGGPGGGPRMGLGGGGRPVMIHLRFTNRTGTPVTLFINDFVSPLGNFAVRPEKLTLEPGQSLETEPMTSQLAGAYTEATATLALRAGGKSEKKALTLKQVAAEAGKSEPRP